MTLEAFKTGGILSILTPGQAIEMFNGMLSKVPVEHFMMMVRLDFRLRDSPNMRRSSQRRLSPRSVIDGYAERNLISRCGHRTTGS